MLFQSEFISNSLKPKLILVFSCFLFIILVSFFRLSAFKSKYVCTYSTVILLNTNIYTVARGKYTIKRRSQNLLDLHLHYVYVVTLTIFTLGLDQIKHVLLEAYYEQIGPHIAFQLWIFAFIFENLGMQIWILLLY